MSLAPGALRPFRVAEAVHRDGAHRLLLDGRPLRLPDGGDALDLRTAALARAICVEWSEAGARAALRPEALPLTRFTMTVAGRVAPERAGAIADLLRFADAELLRHRAEAPRALVEAEEQAWQPWLDWADLRFGAVLPPVTGVMPADPPPAALAALRRALDGSDDDALAVLLGIVPLLGSLVLGLAVAGRALLPADAARLALVDQQWEAERWGEEMATLAERERLARSLDDAIRFLDLARDPEMP